MKHILMTGVTGALGREVLPRLLGADPEAEISVLIRPREGDSPEDRLSRVLRYVLNQNPGLSLDRVRAVSGDVTRPRLGLGPRDYERLCRSVTQIIHGAAGIKLDPPLECARRINVEGTREVLRFAERCPRLRRYAHVSTAFVAGRRRGVVHETELARGQAFVNAYERSKFEAETVVRARMSDLPVTVFRPSIIIGDSRDGHTAAFDTFVLPLRLIASGRVRAIPGSPDFRLDLVPVDFVADAMVRLLDDDRSRGRTYHLVSGWERSLSLRPLLETAVRVTGGVPSPPLTFVTPGSALCLSPEDLRLIAPFFAYLDQEKRFDASTLESHLGDLVRDRPDPELVVTRFLTFCRRTHWGRRLPWEDRPCPIAAAS